ncbi:hypothetical protein ACS0TY_012133 [Phlomoides rotata]
MDDDLSSAAWPEDMNGAGRQFNVETPGGDDDDKDILEEEEEVTIMKEPNIVDFNHLKKLTNYSDEGNWQLANLVKNWEYKQANAVRHLRDNLSKQQQQVELDILEEHRPDIDFQEEEVKTEAEYDSVVYWKQRAQNLEKLLEASVGREQVLLVKLQESIHNLERQSSPVEELSKVLERADNFLHFVLQNAPVIIGHQDKELRYRFIFNHFPSLGEGDVIGKTDMEIFTGGGIKESQDFKKEVLERGLPAKREITFETELFGSKTFLIYVEPVFSKAGETLGVNYMGMEVTDQVRKREKMAKLREEMAVQKVVAHLFLITILAEESMRAKQRLVTMSHEIRSPLSAVVIMTEILSTTKLDEEQRQLFKVMLQSSGDLVLQLVNDILDLFKVDSVKTLTIQTTKFRPREVVKHVLRTAAASLQKLLTVEASVADDIPVEVIGDVLRIRQILTNLVSNAIKFTHEGKVGINLYVVPDHSKDSRRVSSDGSSDSGNTREEERIMWIHCDVYDTGIGIPDHAMPTLFKRYMQVGAHTAGTAGLGLAICKQLVEVMGGDLTVSSVEHHGSTFTFVLPYKVSSISDEVWDVDDGDLDAGVFLFQPPTLGSLISS